MEFHFVLLGLIANGLDPKDPEFAKAFGAAIILMLVSVVGLVIWVTKRR